MMGHFWLLIRVLSKIENHSCRRVKKDIRRLKVMIVTVTVTFKNDCKRRAHLLRLALRLLVFVSCQNRTEQNYQDTISKVETKVQVPLNYLNTF